MQVSAHSQVNGSELRGNVSGGDQSLGAPRAWGLDEVPPGRGWGKDVTSSRRYLFDEDLTVAPPSRGL